MIAVDTMREHFRRDLRGKIAKDFRRRLLKDISAYALNRCPRTKSLTFSADISHGLRDKLPDHRRYRLKLAMSVPANSRANRLLRRPLSDRRKLTLYRRPS